MIAGKAGLCPVRLAPLLVPAFAHAQQIVHVMTNDITISGTLVHICDTVIIPYESLYCKDKLAGIRLTLSSANLPEAFA